MRETAVESHPFRKVREKDGHPAAYRIGGEMSVPGVAEQTTVAVPRCSVALRGIPGLEKRETWGTPRDFSLSTFKDNSHRRSVPPGR